MNYLKRLTDIGSAGDILLTDEAVNTIFALTAKFKGNLYHAGKYPIKHDKYLNVWFYKKGNIGNPKPPKKKKITFDKTFNKNKLSTCFIINCVFGIGI